MHLENVKMPEKGIAMEIIEMARRHLREQGIDQWQGEYPKLCDIEKDILEEKGYFVKDSNEILGYLCVDFGGEPDYNEIKGNWASDRKYVVAHRMAFCNSARGKGISQDVFALVEKLAKNRGFDYFRIDTHDKNLKMQHILKKFGFCFRGEIWIENSRKLGFDKEIR